MAKRSSKSNSDEPQSTLRRRFLTRSIALAAGSASSAAVAGNTLTVPPWSQHLGLSVDAAPYGKPADSEAHVRRRSVAWLTATREAAVNFTPLAELDGIITPNGVCFERHHAGAALIDPSQHKLLVNGEVERELLFSLDELKRFPAKSGIYFLECAANGGMEWRGAQLNACQFTHGMVHCVQYTGVPLKLLLEEAGIKPEAAWILAEGADASAMSRSLPLDKALDDCLVAYSMNGERLRPEQGYPLRLVVPGFEGNLWVKWLRRLEVGTAPWYHREETSKYTDLMPDGKARKFTYEMEAKSVITSPAPEAPVKAKGFNQIKGLAWSGRGRITRVDVSLDGGRNWLPARLDEPVLPRALTRFYLDWPWQGETQLLQSRAVDESGYVQPTMSELKKTRGAHSVYHNNAIQTWQVNADGSVENVRLA